MTRSGGPRVPAAKRRAFQRRLLAWYRRHRRDLPWRETRDPYHILVSEVMLQQTQVSRVVPKYREWLAKYPSLESLARASVREVREAWYPLGYNIRPVRLREIARTAVRRHRGTLPDTREGLLELKGIGPYTAGAVLSFAYGRDAAILDTNVRRLLGRVFLGGGGGHPAALLWRLSEALLPRGQAYDYNQALMDFGATVCTARKPRCRTCALARLCASYPFAAEPAARAGDRSAERAAATGRVKGP